jgi:hypothetical protein
MTLKELTEFCKANRIQEARADGLHIVLHPTAFESLEEAAQEVAAERGQPEPTDDEFMFWSVDAAWVEGAKS